MAITLTHTPASAEPISIELPDQLDWVDEYSWSPVAQNKTYSITGALLIQSATRQAGRPITLEGRIDTAWCPRSLVDQLYAWAATPGIVLSLTLRGIARSVTFDHEKGALQGLPVMFRPDADIADDDWYYPTIRFLEL